MFSIAFMAITSGTFAGCVAKAAANFLQKRKHQINSINPPLNPALNNGKYID
jgi:hypothetical protein